MSKGKKSSLLGSVEVVSAQTVAPAKLAREREELPVDIARAWDETAVNEAMQVHIRLGEEVDVDKAGRTILRLLKERAREQGMTAFKSSAAPAEGGLLIYWHKKVARKGSEEPVPLHDNEPGVVRSGLATLRESRKKKGGDAT